MNPASSPLIRRLPRLRFRGTGWLAFWRTGWWASAKVRAVAALRLLRARRTTPDEIARGAAIGFFFAFAGPPGLQAIPAAAVAVFTRSSAVAAVACVFISNPLTMPFIYAGALKLGEFITHAPPLAAHPETSETFWQLLTDWQRNSRLAVNLITGCLALGFGSAVAVYPAASWGWSKFLESRETRRAEKAARKASQQGAAPEAGAPDTPVVPIVEIAPERREHPPA